ncbi:MAG: PHP domain-containing protein [Thermoleophilia bacterium]
MKLDTHVHTSPGSRCSQMSVDSYLEVLRELEVTVACVTNHGDMGDYDEIVSRAPAGISFIPGVEISSTEGDFLVYSTDLDYLRSLEAAQPLPDRNSRPDETAVIWAHPFAGASGGLSMGEEYLSSVALRVDGIEVYNGNWPDAEASRLARRIADTYGLAELGGSDTHRLESLYRCWTEIPDIDEPAGLIRAIRDRTTKAILPTPSL